MGTDTHGFHHVQGLSHRTLRLKGRGAGSRSEERCMWNLQNESVFLRPLIHCECATSKVMPPRDQADPHKSSSFELPRSSYFLIVQDPLVDQGGVFLIPVFNSFPVFRESGKDGHGFFENHSCAFQCALYGSDTWGSSRCYVVFYNSAKSSVLHELDLYAKINRS